MILTGKAKEDFEKWNNDIYGIVDTAHSNECIEFKHLNPELQNTVIIDWFDSVGIYVSVQPNYIDHNVKYSTGDFKAVLNFQKGDRTVSVDFPLELFLEPFKPISRHEATKQAIIKANEIYNNKKS